MTTDTSNNTKSVENLKSALICAMVGDSMGWVTEFQSQWFKSNINLPVESMMSWKRSTGGRWYKHLEPVSLGEYSDDSQLLIATLRSLHYENWLDYLAFVEFPLWTLYARGAGRGCKNSASILSTGKFPWNVKSDDKLDFYYKSGGNGGVMRILPHLFDSKCDREDLLCMSLINSLLTHGHSNSIIGTLLYADTLHCIYTGVDKGDLTNELQYRLKDYVCILDKTLKMLEDLGFMSKGKFKKNEKDLTSLMYVGDIVLANMCELLRSTDDNATVFNKLGIVAGNRGSALSNALASIFLYLSYTNPYDAIYHCTNTLTCDTDTLASMSGALLGLNCTLEDLPDWFSSVADYDVAIKLTDDLLRGRKYNTPITYVKPKKIKDYLFSSDNVVELDLVGVGRLLIECTRNVETIAPNIEVVQKIIKREDGQRIFIKKVSKLS